MSTRWVLHLCGKLSVGGVQAVIMNFYENIDREKVQFAFAVQRNTPYDYDERILKLGGRIHYLPDLRYNQKEYEKALAELLKEHPEYQIVHAHFNFKNWKMLQISKKSGVPFRISHAHAADTKDRITTKIHLGLLAKLINYYSTMNMSCSYASGKYLYDSDNFIILHNALNLEKFRYSSMIRENKRRELSIEDDTIALCSIGHLNDNKNQFFLIDVLNKLDDNYHLYLVGADTGDDYKRKLEEKILLLGLQDRVTFLGVRNDVYELMQAFDLLLFPSKHEGLGVVCMEAQATGLQVIASDRVPKEVAATKLIAFCEIDSPEKWVDMIEKKNFGERVDTTEEIRKAGYDIVEETKRLQKIYLEQ